MCAEDKAATSLLESSKFIPQTLSVKGGPALGPDRTGFSPSRGPTMGAWGCGESELSGSPALSRPCLSQAVTQHQALAPWPRAYLN